MAETCLPYFCCRLRRTYRLRVYAIILVYILILYCGISYNKNRKFNPNVQYQGQSEHGLLKIQLLGKTEVKQKLACRNNPLFGHRSRSTPLLSMKKGYRFYPESDQNNFPLTTMPNPYKLNTKDICLDSKGKIIVFLVHSATYNFLRRHIVRSSWGKQQVVNGYNFKTVFFLGQPKTRHEQLKIEEEYKLSMDIVQGQFLDTYHNLTNKAVLTLRWAKTFCCNSKLIIKVDDDVTVNIQNLVHELDTFYSHQTRKMFCLIKSSFDNVIWRKDKWKVENVYFETLKYFPYPTCSGFFIAITPDILVDLYNAATVTPFFWIDDVYISGILPSIISDMKVVDLPYNSVTLDYGCALKCLKKTSCNLTAFVMSSDPNFESSCTGSLRRKRFNSKQVSFLT